MMFMNEYEVLEAAGYFRDNPILGPATRALESLMSCVNRNSDGWPYWSKPTQAATGLMNLIQRASDEYRAAGETTVTAAEIRRAYVPIKAFLTRQQLTCDLEPVREG